MLKHIFVTSDHHFGSWKLNGIFRTFTLAQEEELVAKWNSIVEPNDIVYYNGDFCDSTSDEMLQYASMLNGIKTLVKGNHDTLPDEAYKKAFIDVIDEMPLDELGIVVHHSPDYGCKQAQVFGHLHRFRDTPAHIANSIRSCVQFNDGYPLSLERIMLALK